MTISVAFTASELELLVTLASDQLFRREFIDPKMPGHRADHEGVAAGKALVSRLRALVASNRPAEVAKA